jgi:uncharacterized damage-inducible protein DinB
MYDDLASLEVARKAEDGRIIRYVDSLSDGEMSKEFNYTTTKGMRQRYPLQDLLAHLFNHQTHHRGQAHTVLTVLGIPEPQPLDLLGMFRENV